MATTAHTKTVAREKRFNFFTIHFSLCSMALIRGLNMHMKTIRSKFLAGLLGLATSIAMVAMPAQAAQVLKPAYVSGATSAPATPNDINALTLTVPKGQYVTFDVMYSVTAPNGANESGLGLKVRYDSAFFDEMTADTLSAATPPALVTAGSYRTDVTNLLTKCMIASPSPQTISGTQREVVFGWIDTSINSSRRWRRAYWRSWLDGLGRPGCSWRPIRLPQSGIPRGKPRRWHQWEHRRARLFADYGGRCKAFHDALESEEYRDSWCDLSREHNDRQQLFIC